MSSAGTRIREIVQVSKRSWVEAGILAHEYAPEILAYLDALEGENARLKQGALNQTHAAADNDHARFAHE